MTNPLVSVIIPAYGCAKNIPWAIDSVFYQEVEDVEVIVINDRSPDDLDEAMAPYLKDPRVVYVTNEQNMGAAKSRNRGVRMARGKYVAFLDADDEWAKGKLKRQLEILENESCVLCCTARELKGPHWEPDGRVLRVKETITYQDLLKHNSINCSSVVMRADVAREFPMDHEDSHEDYIMWLRVLKKYGPARGINEPLLRYQLSAAGKSGSKWHSARMTFKVYRYMGFSLPKSILYFCQYALHGIRKYYFTRRGEQHEA
ncbi:MAG: glycosyltransferase family 2 protein [Oscillospiraceae bacterium]|nr:glycosyltransferase family 2 protein [Oscillospiraceae bacterium]